MIWWSNTPCCTSFNTLLPRYNVSRLNRPSKIHVCSSCSILLSKFNTARDVKPPNTPSVNACNIIMLKQSCLTILQNNQAGSYVLHYYKLLSISNNVKVDSPSNIPIRISRNAYNKCTLIKVHSEWSCIRRKMKIRLHTYEIIILCSHYTKIGNISMSIQSTARLQKRKQNHNFSVLPVTGENELLFPVLTPQAIF